MTTNNANPSIIFGGTWVAWGSGRVPVGVSSDNEFNTVEKIGGYKTHYHKFNSMPSDGTPPAWEAPNQRFLYRYSADNPHQFNIGTGGEKDSTLQPYITCYMWKRTA